LLGLASLTIQVASACVAILHCNQLSHNIHIVAAVSSIEIFIPANVGQANFIASAICVIFVFDEVTVLARISITRSVSLAGILN